MRKKLFFLSLLTAVLFTTSGVKAQPTYSSGISMVSGGTGIASTEQMYDGVQSYKATGDGAQNPDIQIGINSITNWETITYVKLWVYTSAGWYGGQFYENSGGTAGWNSSSFTIAAANTWEQFTFNFVNIASGDGWGQFGIQGYNKTDAIYLDEITFYNALDEVVYEIDASDVLLAPTSITVSPATISAITGKNQQLSINVLPVEASKSMNYSSNNSAVATVSSTGLVTTVAPGTAIIKAESALDALITGTTNVTVTSPVETNSLVYANFENGLGNSDGAWAAWNNALNGGSGGSGTVPTIAIVTNPSATGINTSSKVLKVTNCYQWGAIAFKAYDMNKYNTIKFKVYADADITDWTLEMGWQNGTTQKINTPVVTQGATWTEYSYTASSVETADRQFYIKLGAANSQEATGTPYDFYIDDVTYIAGDGSTFVPLTGIDVSTTSISTNNGVLQLAATMTPSTATNQALTWSIVNASADIGDTAIFDATAATLKAVRNGTVTVKAVATDGGFVSQKNVTITNQLVKPTALVIADTALTINDLPVQMAIESSTPVDADKTVTWSIESNDGDTAIITADGLLTPIRNGKVIVKATSASNGVILIITKEITITGQIVEVSAISITSANSITVDEGSLTLTAVATPADAANKNLVWSIQGNGTQIASLNGNILQATGNGKLMVRAASVENSAIFSDMEITIKNQIITPDTIFVMGPDGINGITTNFGTLQMFATVSPTYAEPDVIWSVAKEDSAMATISNTGLLSAWADGAVTVIATSILDETVKGETEIIITNQTGAPFIIDVNGANDLTEIVTSFGTLQMFATVSPTYAETEVEWSVAEGDSVYASISETGLLTAVSNGSVTVIASSTANKNIKGKAVIGISNQFIAVNKITVSSLSGENTITTIAGTLQLEATVTPDSATNKIIKWSVSDEALASVSELGNVTAIADGVVTVKASSEDGSGVSGEFEITISNQSVIEGITGLLVNDFILYPNPVNEILYISNAEYIDYVEVISATGKVIITKKNTGLEKFSVNTDELSSGIYIVKIYTKNAVFGVNIVK